ncbi:hypothetical protein E2C01_077085 [Portunus trituberculatus]|uniref:Secreted protein n=1 Tax=Portunus trituberculatus TaxID=210409 RepID=A0A5B7ILA1_PORTR|nr:hypothetical protein [Portunus trituberculatus]
MIYGCSFLTAAAAVVVVVTAAGSTPPLPPPPSPPAALTATPVRFVLNWSCSQRSSIIAEPAIGVVFTDAKLKYFFFAFQSPLQSDKR